MSQDAANAQPSALSCDVIIPQTADSFLTVNGVSIKRLLVANHQVD